MKLRNTMTGELAEATITTAHPASSYGIPVVVIDGEAYGTLDLALSQWAVAEASAAEARLLARADYRLPGV